MGNFPYERVCCSFCGEDSGFDFVEFDEIVEKFEVLFLDKLLNFVGWAGGFHGLVVGVFLEEAEIGIFGPDGEVLGLKGDVGDFSPGISSTGFVDVRWDIDPEGFARMGGFPNEEEAVIVPFLAAFVGFPAVFGEDFAEALADEIADSAVADFLVVAVFVLVPVVVDFLGRAAEFWEQRSDFFVVPFGITG